MISRTKFLKENLIKIDGGSLTDDEIDKQNEEDPLNQTQSHQTLNQPLPPILSAGSSTHGQQGNQKSSNEATNVTNKQAKGGKQAEEQKTSTKGSKQKKDKTESTKVSQELIAQQASEQLSEALVVEEVLTNRPPTPPKLKIVLPPIDIGPFVRFEIF